MIRAESVRKRFRTPVLDGVSFHVRRGERVALLGGNGAGKTTLLRCILGLIDFEGSLTVDGMDPRVLGPDVRLRVGYVPQRPPAGPFPVSAFLALVQGLRGVPDDAVKSSLLRMGLDPDTLQEHTLAELSGGMLQKTVLSVVLAAAPPVLLLDEPTANLDRAAREEVLTALRGLPSETTVLFSTHRDEDVDKLATRTITLERGAMRPQPMPRPAAAGGAS